MLFITAVSLNLAFAVQNQVLLAPPSSIAASPQITAPAVSKPQTTKRSNGDTSAKKFDDEFEITSDPLVEKLRGAMKDGFQAFLDGDFLKAEKNFTKLAASESHLGLSRRLAGDELGLMLELSMSLNGGDSFSGEYWNSDPDASKSAGNARARSIYTQLSPSELQIVASKLFYLTALAQAQQGKSKKAVKSFRKALAQNRWNVDARIEYALLALKEGNFDTARKQLARLGRIFDKKCAGVGCPFPTESKERYLQVSLAFKNMLNTSAGPSGASK